MKKKTLEHCWTLEKNRSIEKNLRKKKSFEKKEDSIQRASCMNLTLATQILKCFVYCENISRFKTRNGVFYQFWSVCFCWVHNSIFTAIITANVRESTQQVKLIERGEIKNFFTIYWHWILPIATLDSLQLLEYRDASDCVSWYHAYDNSRQCL